MRAAGLAACVLLGSPQPAQAAARPKVPYWHVWTDTDGQTHQTMCELQDFSLQSISPPASPQWLDRMKAGDATVVVTVLPAGWTGPWHENPGPQWIVPLSGHWFVETTDGTRTLMGPGEMSFGEDQDAKPDARGHQGHLSGAVGNDPAVLMIVQVATPPTVNSPCHLQ